MNSITKISPILAVFALVACEGSDPVKNDIACVQREKDGAPVICREQIGKDHSDSECSDKLDSTDRADGWYADAATSCPNGSKYDCDITDGAGITKHTYYYGTLGGVRGAIACAVENVGQ